MSKVAAFFGASVKPSQSSLRVAPCGSGWTAGPLETRGVLIVSDGLSVRLRL